MNNNCIFCNPTNIIINGEYAYSRWDGFPASKGTIYIHNEDQIKRVKKDKLQEYLDNGWELGMKPKKHS